MHPLVVLVEDLLLLTSNSEDVVLQGEPDVVRVDARELHADLKRVLVLGNIRRGEQRRGNYAALREGQAGKGLIEDPVEPLQPE
jgi:hypothetical protein